MREVSAVQIIRTSFLKNRNRR